MKVLIAGGGISGLTLAFRLAQSGHEVVCVEPSARPGGVIRTELRDGYLCETGPSTILDHHREVDGLVQELGLGPAVISATAASKRRLIYSGGALRTVPTGPLSLLTSDLLSWSGKLRACLEPFIPRKSAATDSDESVLAFAARRLGTELAEALAAPATVGVFAGEAARLSVGSAFPALVQTEASHRSLARGILAQRRLPRARSISFLEGLEQLPRALSTLLGRRILRGHVREIRPGADWTIEIERIDGASGSRSCSERADAVVLATPVSPTVELLEPILPEVASELSCVSHAPLAIVCLGFGSQRLGMDLAARGFLAARGQGLTMLGCQYESTAFPGRAPAGCTLLRVFLGGTFHPEVVFESDHALITRALRELRLAAGLNRDPVLGAVFRQPIGIPQYAMGHAARVRAIQMGTSKLARLHLSGSALHGVSVSACIANGVELARTLPG